MKRFRFPLESVRTLREQKEREARQQYAATVRACNEVVSRLQIVNLELESCWIFVREQLVARTAALALAHASSYAGALEERQRKIQAELHAAQARVEAAWQALLCATRARETLDRYHDKLLRVHRREAQREEQKFLDELGGRAAAFAQSSRLLPSNS